MDADATTPEYGDGETVNNLTTKVGEKIVLYAIWKECDHDPLTHRYTYTVIDEGKTLKRECSCKGYSETAALYAEDTVYDQKEHPAEVTYSAPEKWEPVLVYSHDGVVMGTIPKNAGIYVASVSEVQINEDGSEETVTASVTYTIEKAEQPAPPKPEYEAKDGKIKIYSVDDSPLKATDSTYDSHKEYQVVYIGADGERIPSGWQEGTEIEGGFAAEFNLDVAYTNYFVYARYSEGTNYKPSDEAQADSEYYFPGIDVTIKIIPGEGVDHVTNIDQGDTSVNGVGISVSAKDDYYLPDDFDITVETTFVGETSSDSEAVCITKEKYKEYVVQNIPNNSNVTITIGNAKKLPVIEAKIVEKQVFEEVKNNTANISRDSSYTAYYEVTDYDITAYSKLELKFNSALEEGTTIIMLDKKSNIYYWAAIGSSVDSIDLTSFTQMGTADTKFAVVDEENKGVELQLQFIIDFSKTENGKNGEALTTTLEATKVAEKNRAPELRGGVNTTLANKSGFSLNTSGSGLTQNLLYTYSASNGVVSKWDNRHGALVLKAQDGTKLPSDATLECTIGETSTIIFANAKDEFVIPIAGPQSGNVEVTIQSNLFPTEETTYGMVANWYVAQSVAEDAVSNGLLVASESIRFTSVINMTPSLKISVEGDKRLYSINDIVKATFNWEDITPGSTVKMSMERKLDSGEYGGIVQTVDYENREQLVQEFLLGGESAGSYRLHIYVLNNLVNVGEAYYYFIIE